MLTKVDEATYEKVRETVPLHDNRVREDRRRGSIYYVQSYTLTEANEIVAHRDNNGDYWTDVSRLNPQ